MSLNKKDYKDHISSFFAEQGKRMSNLSKASIDKLKDIMVEYNIPDIDEDAVFEARKQKRKEQSEARKKEKNADIEGTEEYKAKKEKEEMERLEKEERDRNYKLGDVMGRIIRSKIIRDFYKNNTHEERINIWKAYINRNNIMEWNRFQTDYDTAMGIIGKYEISKTWKIVYNKLGEGSVNIDADGMNVIINSNMLRDKVYEPYMRKTFVDNEINPFDQNC